MFDLFVLLPDIVAGQVDVLPAQGRKMPQKRLVDIPAVFAQCLNRPLHINRIPKDNSADDEIESACTVALILVTAIAELTEPVQEDGTSQRVLSLALIQTNLHAATQFDVLHPVECE